MKTKKIQHIVVEKFTKKNSLQNLTRFHSGLCEFEILSFFKKNYYLCLIFFLVFLQLLQSTLLKNENKSSIQLKKTDSIHLIITWHIKRKTKHWKKGKKNKKWEKVKQ